MTENTYWIDQPVRIKGSFRVDGDLTAPSTVTVKVLEPDGTETSYATASLTNPSTGVYYYDYTPPNAGRYFYRIESTGTAKAAQEGQFRVMATTTF